MATTPWYTSRDIINSVKRKISFPISQATFSENDVLAFANEEMMISQVPSVLQFHEEYFVTYKTVPLQTNVSRYAIPDRATGMKLRDVFYQDQSGNLSEMTRIDEHDKAFYQANIGSNQTVHKFYIEGNDVVLSPSVVSSPTGSLILVFFLRPNQLVKNDRAATVYCFNQNIKINNSLISTYDTVSIGDDTFTAVSSNGGTITAITSYSNTTTLITSASHNLTTGQSITIAGSDSNPSVNGTYDVTVMDDDTFLIDIQVGVAGTTGTYTSPNQFVVGATSILTAENLAAAIAASANSNILGATTSGTDTLVANFTNIYSEFETSNTLGFVIPSTTIGIQFDELQTTYTDSETNVTEDLFIDGCSIDLLKTKPGHTTFLYDITIPVSGISGTSITFNRTQLLVPSGTVSEASISYVLAPIVPGDYMCLANECIIPQIPPDLHNGLAERTAARILAAIGDQQGLMASNEKIKEIEQRQGNLLQNRSEGNPQKIANRHSLLRYGSRSGRRRL